MPKKTNLGFVNVYTLAKLEVVALVTVRVLKIYVYPIDGSPRHIFVMLKQSYLVLMAQFLLVISGMGSSNAQLCQSYEAAFNLEARMQEGYSLKQAQESIISDDYSDGTAACLSAIKREINQMPYAFPLAHQALYRRSRR